MLGTRIVFLNQAPEAEVAFSQKYHLVLSEQAV